MSKIQPHERYYIEQNPDDLSTKELAKVLGRAESTIKKVLDERPKVKKGKKVEAPKVEEQRVPEVKQPTGNVPKGIDVSKFMPKVKHGRNEDVILGTTMSEAASQLSDEIRKQNGHVPIHKALKNAVHRPRG